MISRIVPVALRGDAESRTQMPMPRVKPSLLLAVAALALAALTLAGCSVVDSFYPPEAITSQGRETRGLYDIVFAIAAIVFILVEGLIIFTVLRYRRKPTDTELPAQIHGNNTIEVIWTAIPTIIVGVLFFLSWQVLNTVDARSTVPEQTNIRATAARFQWTFQYLDKDGNVLFEQLAPEIAVPAGRTVHLTLRSPDVNHSFYVPQLLMKRDVIPGRENFIDFTVDPQYEGQTFRGQCAHLCGTYHASMLYSMKVLSAADFDAFVADGTAKAQATPAPSASSEAGAPAGPEVVVTAQNIEYTTKQISAPADTAFTIKFENKDQGVPHNIDIHQGSTQADPIVFDGEIFNGVDSRVYQIPALKAGSYLFVCKVHPNMIGTLTVQ